MQFLKSFFASFFVWQLLSLSPFAITKNTFIPKTNRLHACVSIISIVIQILNLLYGFYDFEHYAQFANRSFVIYVADVLSMTFIRLTSIIAVMESWLKKPLQIEFLRQIDQIDVIIRSKLSINLDYDSQKKKSFRILLFYIGATFGLLLAMLAMTTVADMELLQVYWSLYTIPLFVCVMRYHQFILYVNQLHHRYEVLNNIIECLTLKKLPRDHFDSTCSKMFLHPPNVHRIREIEAILIFKKLKHLQKTQRLLVDANKVLCKMFNWSMMCNVFNDFGNLIFNLYWTTLNFVRGDSKFQLIGVCSWAAFNISMLILLTKACQFAGDEVILREDSFRNSISNDNFIF